jgi:hypothetical protein
MTWIAALIHLLDAGAVVETLAAVDVHPSAISDVC